MASDILTFLFTDIEGSTRLWELFPEAMRAALIRHEALVELLVAEHGGTVVRPRGEGDSRFAVFARPTDAVTASLAIQLAFQHEAWDVLEPVRVRIAVHSGVADLRDGDYYGGPVNRCARLRALGHGGQVLISGLTASLVHGTLPPHLALRNLDTYRLKDMLEPEAVFQLVHPDLLDEFQPLHASSWWRGRLPGQPKRPDRTQPRARGATDKPPSARRAPPDTGRSGWRRQHAPGDSSGPGRVWPIR